MHRLFTVCVPSASTMVGFWVSLNHPFANLKRHAQKMSGCGTEFYLTWQKKTSLPTCSSLQGKMMINDSFNDLFLLKDIAKLCHEEISKLNFSPNIN